MKCAVEMGLYDIPKNFIKIVTGVQAILRCCLRILRGCNDGIMNGKEL
jgi:hypothetical protein